MSPPVAPVVRRLTTANDEFQLLHALLTNRKKRHQRGEFIVQGVKPINAAVASGWPLVAFVVADLPRLSAWATNTLKARPVSTHYVVSPALMQQLAQKDEPVELLAMAQARRPSLTDIAITPTMVLCVCDRLQNPGNLGTIVRSADAFGAAAVALLGHSADPFDPQSVRASTGSIFSTPVVSVDGHEALASWFAAVRRQQSSFRVVGTDESGTPLEAEHLRRPVAILLGAEATGLGRSALAMCDDVVALPTGGVASSLNVAAAASIFLFAAQQ